MGIEVLAAARSTGSRAHTRLSQQKGIGSTDTGNKLPVARSFSSRSASQNRLDLFEPLPHSDFERGFAIVVTHGAVRTELKKELHHLHILAPENGNVQRRLSRFCYQVVVWLHL